VIETVKHDLENKGGEKRQSEGP